MASAPTDDSAASARVTGVRWLVFMLACATSFLLYLHRYSWGVIKGSLKQQTGLSDAELGWLDSAFSASYAACQVPGGLAGDLFGPRRVLTAMILAWSGCLACIGLGHGMLGMSAARVAFGAMQAGCYANLAKVTKSWFPLAVRTRVQGAVSTFSGRLGGAASPVVIATLLMGLGGLGWRQTMFLVAMVGMAFAAAFWLLFRDSPEEHPWCQRDEGINNEQSQPSQSAGGGAKASWSWEPAGLVTFGFLLVHSFTSTLPDLLYVNWIFLFLEEDQGLSKVEMGIFGSLPLIGGAVGGLFGGTLNDLLIRFTGNRRFARSAVGLTGKVISAGLMAWAITLDDPRTMMGALALSKFFTDWSLPTQWAAVTDIGGRAVGTIFGVMNTVGAAAGILAGPLIGGLKQHYGWETVFYLLSIVYVVSGLCWIGIDCTKPLVRDD